MRKDGSGKQTGLDQRVACGENEEEAGKIGDGNGTVIKMMTMCM